MNARTFLATTHPGLALATRDGRGEWTVEQLLAGQDVRCLAADPHNPGAVFAGTQGQGVLRSDDGCKTWQPSGMEELVVKSLTFSPAEPGVIYAGTKPPMVFVSRDGGQSWAELESFRRIRGRRLWFSPAEPSGTAYVQGLAVSATDPNVIVAGIEFGAVVRSADGGQTWSGHRRGALRDCHSLTFHFTEGDWVYEGGGSGAGASFSTNAGERWTQSRKGLDRHYGWAVAADPERPEVWYVSLSPGPNKAHGGLNAMAHIFRTEDGRQWHKLSGGLPDPLPHMPYALLTDLQAPGHVYAGLSNGDVWHSANYGDAWEKLPFNLKRIRRTLIML